MHCGWLWVEGLWIVQIFKNIFQIFYIGLYLITQERNTK